MLSEVGSLTISICNESTHEFITLLGYALMANETHEITDLLKAWSEGDQKALDKLMPRVDRELKKIARKYMSKEKRGNILQPTALVNEALIKLIQENISYENRRHFYALVARRMRQVLVDYARKQPKAEHVNVDEMDIADKKSKDIILLDEALTRFAKLFKRKAAVVECSFFIGLTHAEIADLLGIAPSTVGRDWDFARAWLSREMS